MLSNIKSIVNEDVSNKVVILRADLNIPLVNGVVQDQTRLERLMPTINYLLENQSKLVICSHLGRPKGKFDNIIDNTMFRSNRAKGLLALLMLIVGYGIINGDSSTGPDPFENPPDWPSV